MLAAPSTTVAEELQLLPQMRVPVKPRAVGEDEIPYGVPGLCRNWAGGHADRGSIVRPIAVYRSRMVIKTWFGEFVL